MSNTQTDENTDLRKYIKLNRLGLYAVLLGMIVFYLSPLESGIMTAFKTQQGFIQTPPFMLPPPGEFTIDPWLEAFDRLKRGLINSLLFTIPATVLSATLGSLVAYGLTNTKWRGQMLVLLPLVAGIFIPYQAVLVPLTRFWSIFPPAMFANIIQEFVAFLTVGFVNLGGLMTFVHEKSGLFALIFTHTAYGIPISTLLFRSHYQSIDTSMLEAARLDGASISKIYWRIMLPLSIPMFSVTLIYQFTNVWNDLLFALVLVQQPSNVPVTIALSKFKGSMVSQYNLQMAGAFITALPTLIIYVIFGDQFAEGVAGGGV